MTELSMRHFNTSFVGSLTNNFSLRTNFEYFSRMTAFSYQIISVIQYTGCLKFRTCISRNIP